MSNEIWSSGFYSCDVKKVFSDVNPLTLIPEELDDYCRKAGIVWESRGHHLHVHGCGFECGCHGGRENKNLRPRY